VPEALQAGQEQMAANIALQREGFDVATSRGVAGAATSEGLVGGLLGGPISVAGGSSAEQPTGDDTTPVGDQEIIDLVEASRRSAEGVDLDAEEAAEFEAERAALDDQPATPAEIDPELASLDQARQEVSAAQQAVDDIEAKAAPTTGTSETTVTATTPEGETSTATTTQEQTEDLQAMRVSDEMAQIETELANIEQDFEGLVEEAMDLGYSEAEAVKLITDTEITPRQQKLRELQLQAVATGSVEGRRLTDEEVGVGPKPKAGRRGAQDIDPEQAAAQIEQQQQAKAKPKTKAQKKKEAQQQARKDFSEAGSPAEIAGDSPLLTNAEAQPDAESTTAYLEEIQKLATKRAGRAGTDINISPSTNQQAALEAQANKEARETSAEEQVGDTGLKPRGKEAPTRTAARLYGAESRKIINKIKKSLSNTLPSTEEELEARVLEEGADAVTNSELLRRVERTQNFANIIRILRNRRSGTKENPKKPYLEARDVYFSVISEENGEVIPDNIYGMTPEEVTEANTLANANPVIRDVGRQKGTTLELVPDTTGEGDQFIDADGTVRPARADAVADEVVEPEIAEFDAATGVIDYIIRTGNKFEKMLARRIKKAVAGINIKIVRDLDNDISGGLRGQFEGTGAARGIYVHGDKTVYLNGLEGSSGLNKTVVLHELVHGATLGIIGSYFVNPESLSVPARNAVKYLSVVMTNARDKYMTMRQLGLTSQVEDKLYDAGAFDDIYEFVAYGFTQPEMQDFLSSVTGLFTEDIAESNNLLSRFVSAIRKMFNVARSEATAFTDLITLGDMLIDAPFTDVSPQNMVKAAEKLKKAERNVLTSKGTDDINTGIGGIIKESTTNWTNAKSSLSSRWNALTTPVIKGLNLFLTADQISDWAASVGLTKLKQINDIIQMKMNPAKFRMLEMLKRDIDIWSAFNKKYPLLVNPVDKTKLGFSDFLNYITLEGTVDPSQYKDEADALANLPELVAARADLKKTPNNATKKGAVTRLENSVKDIYAKWNELGAQTETVTRKREARDKNLKPILLADGSPKLETVTMPEAHYLFEVVRNHYHDQYIKRKNLLMANIRKAFKDQGDETDPNTPLGKAMQGLQETFAKADAVKIYFPLMRYGQYWARIGKGSTKTFALFETQADRDEYVKRTFRAMQKAGEALSLEELMDTNFIDTGLSTENFGSILTNLAPGDQGAAILKKLDGLLDAKATSTTTSAGAMTQQLDAQAIEQIRSQMYQMYLMTLPDRDIRKRFSPRKGTAGFSGDGLRSMVVNGVAAANQLSRLEFAADVRNLFDETQQNQVVGGLEERNKKEAMVQAYFGRIKNELAPEFNESLLDKMAIFGNQTSFIMLLTSMKSAVVQFTQLPIVGTPVLAARYGFGKTMKMMGNYALLFNKFGLTKRDPVTGEITTRFGQPSIGDSKYVEKKPHLRKAWQWGHEINFFQDNVAADAAERTDKPTDIYDSGLSQVGRGVYRFMTGAFYHAERITREVMFMSAFELEYDRLKKQGKTDEEAFAEGVESAYRTSIEALFNYNRFNKPPIMKDYPVGRVAFQFMTYTQQMVAFMYKNFKGMLPLLNKEGKKEAATKFFGTMMMTGLVFSGLTGLPFYSIIMNALTALRDAEDEDGLPENLDVWFRAVWIKETFGEGSDLAKLLDLDAKDSRMLERVAEMGLLSAITDLNIGSSTSLDTLFFASDNLGRDTRSQLQEFVFTKLFGPTGSLVLGAIDGIEDIQNGEVTRGFEKFTPAMFRGAVKNLRLMDQGEMARTGAIVGDFNREFFAANPEKLVAQAFGFASTEVSQQQKRNILLKRMEIDLKKERQQVLNRLNAASRRLELNASQSNIEDYNEQLDAVDEYNRTIGKFLLITNETLDKSLNNKAKKIAEAYRGLVIDKSLAPVLDRYQISPRPR
jgi:hypothetical protein